MNPQIPWPKTKEELMSIIDVELKKEHDYSTAAESPAIVAVAAFNFVATQLGITGFQAGWGELRFIQMSKGYEYFILLNLDDCLYPQYDLHQKLEEFRTSKKAKAYLKDKAKELLKNEQEWTLSEVKAHWEKLAKEV